MQHNQYTPKEECTGKVLHFRLSDRIYNQIRGECERRGITTTEWMREASALHIETSQQLPDREAR
jgi:hypothetical protein